MLSPTKMLRDLEASEERQARRNPMKLRGASELPNIAGERLRFDLTLEGEPLEASYVITCMGDLVWREPAYYEDWERFGEVKALFKGRYGDRFVSLTPSESARNNMIGDSFRAVALVTPD